MNGGLRVNLHCHSNLSDGQLSPEELAELLLRSGVQVAALTDHDTVAGLARFREALASRGVAVVSGLELSVRWDGRSLHLLVYGFDPDAPALARLLEAARSEAGLPVAQAFEGVRAAGGHLFLAHPLEVEADPVALRVLVERLCGLGLDGLEAIYGPYRQEQILDLLSLADEFGLVVSAGCDFHGPDMPGLEGVYMLMPRERWTAFRDRLLERVALPRRVNLPLRARRREVRMDWRNFLGRILLPTLAAFALLVVPLFSYVLPAFERSLVERKRETIQELTRSARSILEEYHQDELAGKMTRAEAQRAAAGRIQFLRYGKEGKDYFWITDLQPRMIMHPYRPELNGQDLGEFQDPRGNRVFVEFVKLVEAREEGYLEYVWQWKDDPRRLAPKQSYVCRFKPWGWVIGTGIYIEDVQAEIHALTDRIVRLSLGAAFGVAALLLFVTHQSLRLERRRSRAEDALRDSHERYRALVEASQEGTVLVQNGRPVYANARFLEMVGLDEDRWGLLELEELFELQDGGLKEWAEAAAKGISSPPREGRLLRQGAPPLEVLLASEPVRLGDREGCILMVRDASAQKEVQAALGESQARFRAVAENLRVAVLRTEAREGMAVLEANPAAHRLLGIESGNLSQALEQPEDLEMLRRDLLAEGEIRDRVLRRSARLGGGAISWYAVLVRDEAGNPKYCDALVEDVTDRERESLAREALIAELQTPLLFLNEPVKRTLRPVPEVPLETPVQEAALLMSRQHSDAILVQGPRGEALGLLTDQDLRERVLGVGFSPLRPVFEAMSSPIHTVPPETPGHEALRIMQERDIRHLIVREVEGPVLGIVHGQDLFVPGRYPMAQLVSSIREASRPEEVVERRAGLFLRARALVDSGAHPRHVCRAISAVSDVMVEKLVAFARARLGEPPAPYAFLALGSLGRGEQTLFSDQDNALVYLPTAGTEEETARYFREFSEFVCGWLDAAGLFKCQGGMMASNPRWCQPLGQWERLFSGWIRLGEPKDLLEFGTFFDLRCSAGDPSLVASLRAHIHREVAECPAFLGHLARETLQYKPPLSLFGNLVAETGSHGHPAFDAKEALAPAVHFARLYSLQRGLSATGTLDRLDALRDMGALSPSGHGDLSQAFELLQGLRLRHQGDLIAAGQSPDNEIELRRLTHMETALLKQVLAGLQQIQKKAHYDFLGGAPLT